MDSMLCGAEASLAQSHMSENNSTHQTLSEYEYKSDGWRTSLFNHWGEISELSLVLTGYPNHMAPVQVPTKS
jgi:hypothetical protein